MLIDLPDEFHYVPLSAELLFSAKLSSDPGPLFFPPSHQSLADISGIETQNVANAFKAEKPIAASSEEPSMRAVEKLFVFSMLC